MIRIIVFILLLTIGALAFTQEIKYSIDYTQSESIVIEILDPDIINRSSPLSIEFSAPNDGLNVNLGDSLSYELPKSNISVPLAPALLSFTLRSDTEIVGNGSLLDTFTLNNIQEIPIEGDLRNIDDVNIDQFEEVTIAGKSFNLTDSTPIIPTTFPVGILDATFTDDNGTRHITQVNNPSLPGEAEINGNGNYIHAFVLPKPSTTDEDFDKLCRDLSNNDCVSVTSRTFLGNPAIGVCGKPYAILETTGIIRDFEGVERTAFNGTPSPHSKGQPSVTDTATSLNIIPRSVFGESFDGSGITIYVLDTGYSNGLIGTTQGFVNNTNSVVGDQGQDTEEYMTPNDLEVVGHGTWVATTAMSIAEGASVKSIKVCTDGSCKLDNVIDGICKILDEQSERTIINMSFAFPRAAPPLEKIIRNALEREVLIVAAAGQRKESDDEDYPSFPAKYDFDGVISVGAGSIENGEVIFEDYSNQNTVHIVAPGHSILKEEAIGTSYAAPYVSGAFALLMQKHDGLTTQLVGECLGSPNETIHVSDLISKIEVCIEDQ